MWKEREREIGGGLVLELGDSRKKNGVHRAEAGGWLDSEIFMSVFWRGDEATNRAQM